MTIEHVVAAALVFASASAFAQFPPRGQPDPSLNAGRPRIIAGSAQASGVDYALLIVPITPTRFAVQLGRPLDAKDAVLIVDTTPERETVFDVRIGTVADTEGISTLVSAGTGLVIGGTVYNADGSSSASLQVREIGVAALPAFDERGSLITPPSSALRPLAFTNALAAMRLPNGQTQIWQGRTQYTPDAGCSGAMLHRVDHNGSSLLERYLVDLTSALVRTCIDALAAFTAPARTGDTVGSQALVVAAVCQDQSGGRAYACLTRVLDTGSALVIDRAWGSNGLAVFGSSGTADMFVTGAALDAAGGAWVAANRSATGNDSAAFLIHFSPDGAIDARSAPAAPSPSPAVR
jgi:hypothetical protein